MWLMLWIAAGFAFPISLGILAFRMAPTDCDIIHPGF
jgi:hypothetical protein